MECDRWTSVGNTARCISRDYRHCCEHREHSIGCRQHRQNFTRVVPTNNSPCESLHIYIQHVICMFEGFRMKMQVFQDVTLLYVWYLLFWRIVLDPQDQGSMILQDIRNRAYRTGWIFSSTAVRLSNLACHINYVQLTSYFYVLLLERLTKV